MEFSITTRSLGTGLEGELKKMPSPTGTGLCYIIFVGQNGQRFASTLYFN